MATWDDAAALARPLRDRCVRAAAEHVRDRLRDTRVAAMGDALVAYVATELGNPDMAANAGRVTVGLIRALTSPPDDRWDDDCVWLLRATRDALTLAGDGQCRALASLTQLLAAHHAPPGGDTAAVLVAEAASPAAPDDLIDCVTVAELVDTTTTAGHPSDIRR